MMFDPKDPKDIDTSDDESITSNSEDENIEEPQNVYKESFWPAKPDTPRGFTYKGKSNLMTHAMEKIKCTLKRGSLKEINGLKFKISDVKLHGGATQVTVEMFVNEERGIAIAELWGPNKRKECTILIKKSKEYDEKYVSILAKQIIQPCLDCIVHGKSLHEFVKNKNKNTKKGTNSKCNICEKSFTSEKYLKVHMTKIHTKKSNKCKHCDYTDHSNIKLREHIKITHADADKQFSNLTSQPESMDTQTTLNGSKFETLNELSGKSWEEKRMDDQIMDTEIIEEHIMKDTETLVGSKHRDEQIKKREREEEKEIERSQNSEDTNLSKKKSSRRKRKKRKSLRDNSDSALLPPGFKHVPKNIKHLTKSDDLVLSIVPDGACLPRAGAAHIFEDQNEGIRFRSVINTHMVDRWSYYSEKIAFPYKREIGLGGQHVEFETAQEYLDFLRRNPHDAKFLWSDTEELVAISNLYQIDINIIETKGINDQKPSMNTIKADAKLAIFSILPKGKVPNMTVVHTGNNHYDLIVSKISRIAQKTLSNVQTTPEKEENIELSALKEEYELLRKEHSECLKKIEKLQNELETSKESKEVDKEYEANTEEQILLKGKLEGFSQECPQSEPKPFTCILCANKFKTKDQLEKHVSQHTNDGGINCKICTDKVKTEDELKKHITQKHANDPVACNICNQKIKTQDQLKEHLKTNHTNDGDWNCDDCDHQTNSQEGLMRHLNATHHNSQQIPNPESKSFECNFCEMKFFDRKTLEEHKKRTHKSFKPCRNLPNCQYGVECIFNHNSVRNDLFLCYECGKETKTLSELMIHRKNNHIVNDCINHQTNTCRHGSEKCWFNHKQLSVFRDPPSNLAPPSPQPTQATWLKMVEMVDQLNNMMKEMRETGQFQ